MCVCLNVSFELMLIILLSMLFLLFLYFISHKVSSNIFLQTNILNVDIHLKCRSFLSALSPFACNYRWSWVFGLSPMSFEIKIIDSNLLLSIDFLCNQYLAYQSSLSSHSKKMNEKEQIIVQRWKRKPKRTEKLHLIKKSIDMVVAIIKWGNVQQT